SPSTCCDRLYFARAARFGPVFGFAGDPPESPRTIVKARGLDLVAPGSSTVRPVSASKWQPGQLLFVGFDGLEIPPELGKRIEAGRVGGVVLFRRNIEGPEQLRTLIRRLHELAPADAPLTVAIDQEGGRVQRLREPWTE